MNNIHELVTALEINRLRRETARLERDTEEILLERNESIARIQMQNIEEALKRNELLDAEMKNRDAKRTRADLQARIAELELAQTQVRSWSKGISCNKQSLYLEDL